MATPEEAQFAAQFKGSTKPDQTTPEAAQFNKQFYGASSTDKPKEADTSNTGAAIALGAADLFGGLSTMGGFIGKGFEALGGYDFPVLTRRNNQWGLTPISQASFEDAVGSSENLARVFNSVGINTEFTPDRTKGEEWKNTATRFAVGGLPFIVKSISTSLGKEGIKAALRTTAQEAGAVVGSAGAMQLAEDQGPGGQLIAAVIGDVLGRHPVRAVTTTPVTAAKGGAGIYSKAKSVVRGREPRERAAELMHKLVPDPDALRQLIDTHPDAKSLYDLPGTINTKELIDRVAALSPEARVQFMRAAKQTQAKMISKLVDDNVTEGIMSAQNQVGSNFDEMRLTAIKANDKALKSVAAAIDGLDGGNVEGLANNAKRAVLEAREEVRKGISQQFDAVSHDLKSKHFVDVVKNTKASYIGREADMPDLPEIKKLHKRITKYLAKGGDDSEVTLNNFQAILRDVSATERNILSGGSRGTYSSDAIKRYLNTLEDSLLDAFGKGVGDDGLLAFKQARRDWKKYRDLYDRSILKSFSEPDYKLTPELSTFAGKGAKGGEALDKLLEGAPEAEEIMREYVLSNFVKARSSIPHNEFVKFKNDYAPVIRRLGLSGQLDNIDDLMRKGEEATAHLTLVEKEMASASSVYTLFTGTSPKFAVRNLLNSPNSPEALKDAWLKVRMNPAAKKGFLNGIVGEAFESAKGGTLDDPFYSGEMMKSWIKRNEQALTGIPDIGSDGVENLIRIAEDLDNTLAMIKSPPSIATLQSESPIGMFYARIAANQAVDSFGGFTGTPGGSMQKAQQVSGMVTKGMKKLQRDAEVEAILTKAVLGDLGDVKLLLKEGMGHKEALTVMDWFKKAKISGVSFVTDKAGKVKWKFTPVGTPALVGATGVAAEKHDGSQ